MKNKLTTIVFLFISLLMSLFVNGKSVDETMAKQVAANFSHMKTSDMGLIYTSTNTSNENLFYVFGHANGFILIAADDRIEPILGYSNEGPFLLPQVDDSITGNNFWGLMNTYTMVINDVIENDLPGTDDITIKWIHLRQSDYTPKSTNAAVPALMTTTYGQGWPYNSMCPADPAGPGGHVWVGCVGTAMMSIMQYYKYPEIGLGSLNHQSGPYSPTYTNFNTPYNWQNMPNSTSVVNNDISKAMYHAANSVGSIWGSGSTGVSGTNGEDPMTRAFVNYFKFAYSSIQFIGKIDYTASQWDSYLQTELLANRVIYYRGDGIGSHAWVCDGFDESNLYHFNFGWDGSYNGYYSLGNINPGSSVFTNNQMAIIGIKPNDGSTLLSNTAWSGTMNITSNICVPDSLTLTINPGALIKFAQGCKLQVFGRILSNGTSSNYAKFTTIDTSLGWEGIKWDNNYMNGIVMANNDTSILNYTQVEYSKNSGIFACSYSKLILNRCRINNNQASYGAGLNILYHPISIYYSEIDRNHATIKGGGIYMNGNNDLITNISHNNIHNNVADASGGGAYLNNITLKLDNNYVHYNQSAKGSGIGMMFGSPNIVNNKICNNTSPMSSGLGAVYTENATPNIVNNLIANNTATGIVCSSSSPNIFNNTIVNNNHNFGSGIVFGNTSNGTIKNCIIYGNSANDPTYGNQITLWGTDCDPSFDHCDIQGGLVGFGGPGSGANYTISNYTNNIDLFPQFVAPTVAAGAGYDGLSANWQLQASSPCINAGDITGIANLLPPFDLAGNPRLYGTIDMGAYEFQGPVSMETLAGVKEISIYPNPSNGVFTVSAGKQITNVLLYDVYGSLIKQQHPSGNQTITMDCSELPKGIYFVHVSFISGTVIRKLVVE